MACVSSHSCATCDAAPQKRMCDEQYVAFLSTTVFLEVVITCESELRCRSTNHAHYAPDSMFADGSAWVWGNAFVSRPPASPAHFRVCLVVVRSSDCYP